MAKTKLKVGLLGVGRMGKVYARSLAVEIPETTLAAVADTDAAALQSVADEFGVSGRYRDPQALIEDPEVEAVVIVTPTHTHHDLVELSAQSRKPVFCEKPLSLSLEEALKIKAVIEKADVFFQMGFMRRFDRGYASAREKIEQGLIGSPVLFKSTSRDPFAPKLEYLNLDSSGGIFVDMGIHDFDLALWFFGALDKVVSIGGVLAYPEIESTGDIDNGIVSLSFADGRIGVIDLSRSGVYGYDICTEILGTEGTLRIGYLRETPLLVMKENQISHDTVPYFMERFGEAYTRQLRNFAQNVLRGRPAPVTVDDGIEALRVAVAATRSYQTGQSVAVTLQAGNVRE